MKLKHGKRALKRRTWTARKAERCQRKFANRVKASQSVDIVASMVVPYQMFVRVYVPGRLLAKSKVRAR